MNRTPPAVAALALFAATATAHNFWVTPSAFYNKPNEPVNLTLLVGHDGNAEHYDRNPAHIKRFWSVAPDGTEHDVPPAPQPHDPLADATHHHPAGQLTPRTPGVHIVCYRSNPSEIELDAKKFTGYLEEEGLDHIIAARADRNETDQPGRESYSRACKTLVLVGDHQPGTPTQGFDRRIGLTLEITPLTDPFNLKPGDEFRVSVYDSGKPATNVQIDAEQWTTAGDLTHLKAHTNDRGEATFTITQPGTWLITTTTMERATPRTTTNASIDWTSTWASLTIQVQAD